jgi:hypothetical protein
MDYVTCIKERTCSPTFQSHSGTFYLILPFIQTFFSPFKGDLKASGAVFNALLLATHCFSSIFSIYRFHDFHRSMRSVVYLHTTSQWRYDETMTSWRYVGLQQSEVTVVHAFAVWSNIITYVIHVFSGAEETGQKGLAVAGVHRCVWIVHMWNLLEVTFCSVGCLVFVARRGKITAFLQMCMYAKVRMLVVRSRDWTS